MLQDNADSGVLGKVQGFVTAGIKWFTTGRKRGGVLTSMQGMPTLCHDSAKNYPRRGVSIIGPVCAAHPCGGYVCQCHGCVGPLCRVCLL